MDMVEEEILDEATESLWVFGYGSLCWNPGFKYSRKHIGRIRGFSRRFYQGNTTHRGIPGYPGRCATLVEDAEDVTYGVAFELEGETALTYLNQREVKLGSYGTAIAIFEATEEEGIDPSKILLIRWCIAPARPGTMWSTCLRWRSGCATLCRACGTSTCTASSTTYAS